MCGCNCITFFFTFSVDGCFVQPKHVAAIAFALIKVVCRRSTSLLVCVPEEQQGCHTAGLNSRPNVRYLQCSYLLHCPKQFPLSNWCFLPYLWRKSRTSGSSRLSIYMPSHTISTTGLTEYKSDQSLDFVLFQSAAFIFRYRQWNYLQTTTKKRSVQRSKTSMRTNSLSTDNFLDYN